MDRMKFTEYQQRVGERQEAKNQIFAFSVGWSFKGELHLIITKDGLLTLDKFDYPATADTCKQPLSVSKHLKQNKINDFIENLRNLGLMECQPETEPMIMDGEYWTIDINCCGIKKSINGFLGVEDRCPHRWSEIINTIESLAGHPLLTE